ncbi:MAG: 2-amino-4-hydroxy-6-hydroxymethyldihydropteridine diphosphokinase [Acidimicrobiia bacterium]|nr:2-amino-4-hydroxy-6-hydroxymethyldihydropteridine diphosphokinase [Acidimicrobiia bacterium]
MRRVAVGLGANLGDRRATLAGAVRTNAGWADLVAVSSLYETAPVGGPDQGPYLNAVAVIDTGRSVADLLDRALGLEASFGRERRERWGPRVLDLDVLLAGDTVIDRPGLRVPHPRMADRRFVLEPLVEAWPRATLPDGTRLVSLLPAVADQEVERIAPPGWWRP